MVNTYFNNNKSEIEISSKELDYSCDKHFEICFKFNTDGTMYLSSVGHTPTKGINF